MTYQINQRTGRDPGLAGGTSGSGEMTVIEIQLRKHMKRLPQPAIAGINLLWLLAAGLLLLAGCAFDLVHAKQVPVSYTTMADPAKAFVLLHEVKATLGTSYPTRLKAGTRWRQVGNTEHGAVFGTQDQIVTDEDSNIHEARLVVSDDFIKGFYLPVEKTFVPVKHPRQTRKQPQRGCDSYVLGRQEPRGATPLGLMIFDVRYPKVVPIGRDNFGL